MTIMNATQTGPHTSRSGDPRIGWSSDETLHAPVLRHRRDGILPTVAAALSVRGATLTGTAARGDGGEYAVAAVAEDGRVEG
ncbi:hypothetical protein P1P75_27985, partial [Streptomyces sp. ID05-39B]|nr:hypothetical protein [Streptomyces sp. ID05-39B]